MEMGHFNVKFFLLVVIYLLCPVCTQELMKTCGIVPTKVKIFECDQMFMSDINRNLTKLASMEKSAGTPINVRLMRISFPSNTNKSPTLPKAFFNADIQVQHLILYDTKVFSIERDAFNTMHFAPLESLQIIRIPITHVLEGIFNGLTNLKQLTLEQLNIHSIGPNIFKPLQNLEIVVIKHCGEEVVMFDNFFGGTSMNKLSKVSIEFCHLMDTITEATFAGLQNVTELRLSKNRIQRIGPRSFHIPLKTLRLLKLDWNDLKSISSDLFNVTHKPRAKIGLNQNPWHCDCNLEKFQKFLRQYNYDMKPLTCKSPPERVNEILSGNNKLCDVLRGQVLDPLSKPVRIPIRGRPTTGEPIILSDEPEKELISVEENGLVDGSSKQYRVLVNCSLTQIPFRVNQSVVISKPMGNIMVENQQLIVDSKYFPKTYSLIEFGTSLNNSDKHVSKCWTNQKFMKKKGRRVIIKSELKSDQANQFCWVEYGSTEPLNCMTFHSFRSDDIVDPWLTIDQKTIMITIVACAAVLAPLVGIATACCLAKVFPRKIGGQKPVEIVPPSLTPKEKEAVERIRLAEIPLRRRFSSRRYDRPMVQMSSHAAVFDNFTINKTSEDMTPVGPPPDVPIRNNSPNCLKIEVKWNCDRRDRDS